MERRIRDERKRRIKGIVERLEQEEKKKRKRKKNQKGTQTQGDISPTYVQRTQEDHGREARKRK